MRLVPEASKTCAAISCLAVFGGLSVLAATAAPHVGPERLREAAPALAVVSAAIAATAAYARIRDLVRRGIPAHVLETLADRAVDCFTVAFLAFAGFIAAFVAGAGWLSLFGLTRGAVGSPMVGTGAALVALGSIALAWCTATTDPRGEGFLERNSLRLSSAGIAAALAALAGVLTAAASH